LQARGATVPRGERGRADWHPRGLQPRRLQTHAQPPPHRPPPRGTRATTATTATTATRAT